ncbi:unnamed protein product, partial [Phaedon cochleariae]
MKIHNPHGTILERLKVMTIAKFISKLLTRYTNEMLPLWLFLIELVTLNDQVFAVNRIVGGRKVSIEDFPYQLSLRLNGKPICGAVLISADTGLTAAHCLPKSGSYTVRAGSSSVDSGGVIVPVSRAILHPENNLRNDDYDIGILKFSRPLRFSNSIRPVKLPEEFQSVPDHTKGNVSGWGSISGIFPFQPDFLHAVDLPVLPSWFCQFSYRYIRITPRMFCAGYREGGRDSCQVRYSAKTRYEPEFVDGSSL